MKTQLNLGHREYLSAALPKTGHNFSESVRIRNLRNRISIGKDELAELHAKYPQGIPYAVSTKEFDFSEKDLEVIAGGLSMHKMQCEENKSVPTADEYLDLHLDIFADAIRELGAEDDPEDEEYEDDWEDEEDEDEEEEEEPAFAETNHVEA